MSVGEETGAKPARTDTGAARSDTSTARIERYKQRGVFLRVLVYVFVTHAFAGFIILLFYLGEHARK